MTPKKYPQNFHTQKIFIFLKTQKIIKIQNFGQKKNDPSLRMHENIRVPPSPHEFGTCIIDINNLFQFCFKERSGSVAELLTGDRGVGGSSLTGVTALWS